MFYWFYRTFFGGKEGETAAAAAVPSSPPPSEVAAEKDVAAAPQVTPSPSRKRPPPSTKPKASKKAKVNSDWETIYQEVAKLVQQHGSLKSLAGKVSDDLQAWIASQQKAVNKEQRGEKVDPILTPYQLRKLKEIGFAAKARTKAPVRSDTVKEFDDMMVKLTAFKEKYNTANVPGSYEDAELAAFVKKLRERYAKMEKGKKPRGALTDQQIEQLNALGFAWRLPRGRPANLPGKPGKYTKPAGKK